MARVVELIKRDYDWSAEVRKLRMPVTPHRLAILPGASHYDINVAPSLASAVVPFLDGN